MTNTDRDARFWNRMAQRYARTPIRDEASYRQKIEMTQSYMRPDMKVLEIGCGTGTTALIHAAHVAHLDAIDISDAMIGIAVGKAGAEGIGNVTFRQGDLASLGAEDGSYDMVLALNLLHLLSDRGSLIREAFRILRPGGLFVTSTMCLDDALGWTRILIVPGRALGLLPNLRYFTSDALRRALAGAGFSILEDWQPGPRAALFLIAQKPAAT